VTACRTVLGEFPKNAGLHRAARGIHDRPALLQDTFHSNPWGTRKTGQWSCCVFVDQAAEDIAAVDLVSGWRFRSTLAR
jgi:hypothetical protein